MEPGEGGPREANERRHNSLFGGRQAVEMIDFAGEMAYNGASEQVLGTHEIATLTADFLFPSITSYLFDAKRVVQCSCYRRSAVVAILGSKPALNDALCAF